MSLRDRSVKFYSQYSDDLTDGAHMTSTYKLESRNSATTVYEDGFWAKIEYLKQEVYEIENRVYRSISLNKELLAGDATWLTLSTENETIKEELTTIFRQVRSNIHDMRRHLEEKKVSENWTDAQYRMHKVQYTDIFRRVSIVMEQYLEEQAIFSSRLDEMVENQLWIPLKEQGNKQASSIQICDLQKDIQKLEKKMTELQLHDEIHILINEYDDDSDRIDLQVELAKEYLLTPPVRETIQYRRSRRDHKIVKWLNKQKLYAMLSDHKAL